MGIFLVALISSVLHHLIVSHRCGGPRDLHPSQAYPVGKVRATWRTQSRRKLLTGEQEELRLARTELHVSLHKEQLLLTRQKKCQVLEGERKSNTKKEMAEENVKAWMYPDPRGLLPGTPGALNNWQR